MYVMAVFVNVILCPYMHMLYMCVAVSSYHTFYKFPVFCILFMHILVSVPMFVLIYLIKFQ